MDDSQRLETILRAVPAVMQVLRAARDLALPDWMLVSGAVYQPVLNHLTCRSLEYGLKDFDVAYFDARDRSYEAEDAVIRRAAAAFSPLLRDRIEVRNQARVHLWFENHFGEPYAPLRDSADSLLRYPCATFAVGVRLEAHDALTVFAPFGLEDLFALRLSANPLRPTPWFAKKVASARRGGRSSGSSKVLPTGCRAVSTPRQALPKVARRHPLLLLCPV